MLTSANSLAGFETRLVLAKMIWNFDMDLHPDTVNDWFDQKVHILWKKPSLYVQLKPVTRAKEKE